MRKLILILLISLTVGCASPPPKEYIYAKPEPITIPARQRLPIADAKDGMKWTDLERLYRATVVLLQGRVVELETLITRGNPAPQ